MIAIAGLGNPGSQYENTRHNVGFQALDLIASSSQLSWQSKPSCEFCRTRMGGESVLLVKPMTFMNLSGEALQPLLAYYKVELEDLIVIHDELDIVPGQIKLKKGGGAAGNQGIKNIIKILGPDFTRVRVGIGHPRDLVENSEGEKVKRGGRNQDVSAWVLGQAGSNDQELLDKAISFTPKILEVLIRDGLKSAQASIKKL